MLVLDTDHLSALERRGDAGDRLRERVRQAALREPVLATVVSYEEQMRGWMAYLARARTVAARVEAYEKLLRHLNNYRTIEVLAFDEVAATEFQWLKKLNRDWQRWTSKSRQSP